MKNLKVKPLTKNQILISIDRLTRFKNTEIKYLRVFIDIITSNLIEPKYKKSDLELMDYAEIKDLAEYIINYSLLKMDKNLDEDYIINQQLYEYENKIFKQDENTEKLLKNKINYKACLDFITEDAPINLKWLKSLETSQDLEENRFKYSLKFPLEKIIIAEGATEETLLPEFARLCQYDFDREGIYVMSAGGKNQVVKLYYKLIETLKLPIFILLDKDAQENLEEIKPKLRPQDKIHLLNCGEFEDLLPTELIKKTLDYELKNISILEKEMLDENTPRVKYLEEVFKNRGMHEFKKVEFAQMIKRNIKTKSDITPEVLDIIEEIKKTKNLKRSS